MSPIDRLRMRVRKDLVAPFRIIVLLLPLACLIEVCAALNPDLSLLRQRSFISFVEFFPPIYATSYNSLRAIFLIGAILLIAFQACPDRHKRPFLTFAAAIFIAFCSNVEFASAFVAGIAFLWLVFRPAGRLAPKLLAIAIFTVLLGFLALTLPDIRRILAFGLTITAALKAYSEAIDLQASLEVPVFYDHFLLLVGGFPCNFIGPYYSQASFTKTFLARPWEEIARKGVSLIYSGVLKLALVMAYYYLLFLGLIWPNPVAPWGGSYLSTSQLWAYGFVGFLNYLLIQVGCYQLQQGLNRLFGYDLEDQCNKPWLSTSPLDFWRRLTAIDRNFMLKYVFYPSYREFGSVYLPILLVFHVVALQQYLRVDVPAGRLDHIRLIAAFIREDMFCWQFSLYCIVEVAIRTFRKKPDVIPSRLETSAHGRRFLAIAALWAFFIASFFQRWVFFLPAPWPTQVRGYSVSDRYAALWSCLAGYCWNPSSRK